MKRSKRDKIIGWIDLAIACVFAAVGILTRSWERALLAAFFLVATGWCRWNAYYYEKYEE